MDKSSLKHNGNLIIVLKVILTGIIIAETFLLTNLLLKINFLSGFSHLIKNKFVSLEVIGWILTSVYLFSLSLLYEKDKLFLKLKLMLKSKRYDLFTAFYFGVLIVFILSDWQINFLEGVLNGFRNEVVFLFIISPLIISVILKIRSYQTAKTTDENDSKTNFLKDSEINDFEDDKLNLEEKVKSFSEKIYNNGSPDSLVFGVEAPWGTGKSSFVNLCKSYLTKTYNDKIIFYKLDLLQFEKKCNILEEFVCGLIKVINQNVYVPEINYLISRSYKYLKKSKFSFSFFGLNIGISDTSASFDNIIEKLEFELKNLPTKIIVVIDNLDRVDFSLIKELLFPLKRVFELSNVSYILCYDLQNITSIENKELDSEKIGEFLEKFINVNFNLIVDSKEQIRFIDNIKEESLIKNITADPMPLSMAMEGLKDIFKSKNYDLYSSLVGDFRKLKKIINTIVLLRLDGADFYNYDIDKHDFIHLLLIYICYPDLFRKIYNEETNGKFGFFSLVRKGNEGYPFKGDSDFENSTHFSDYINSGQLTNTQILVLKKVFDKESKPVKKKIDETNDNPFACFNNSQKGNLSKYLEFIANAKQAPVIEQNQFYLNLVERIIKEPVKNIFEDVNFAYNKDISSHIKLWSAIQNTKREKISVSKAEEIIEFLADSISYYPIISLNNNYSDRRSTLLSILAKLLDSLGWQDESGLRRNNTNNRIINIAYWIYGEEKYKEQGILERIFTKEKKVLGLYNLLNFRVDCFSENKLDISNLPRALALHSDDSSQIGVISNMLVEEMREISQYVFKVFDNEYIKEKKNVFAEIDKLELEDLCGKFIEYVMRMDEDSASEINRKYLYTLSDLKAFIVYQLAAINMNLGVGCGYYYKSGSEKNREQDKESKISYLMNKYLFEICFSPEHNENNYLYFIDYIFVMFMRKSDYPSSYYGPSLKELSKTLDLEMLTEYWKKHKNNVVDLAVKNSAREVSTGNYKVTYAQRMTQVIEELDKLLE